MKRITFLIISIALTGVYLLTSNISLIYAQDAPNANVTKRRPDRPAGYSPIPTSTSATELSQPEVKQVQTSQTSFFADLWDRIKVFFAQLFQQPQASTTTATP